MNLVDFFAIIPFMLDLVIGGLQVWITGSWPVNELGGLLSGNQFYICLFLFAILFNVLPAKFRDYGSPTMAKCCLKILLSIFLSTFDQKPLVKPTKIQILGHNLYTWPFLEFQPNESKS